MGIELTTIAFFDTVNQPHFRNISKTHFINIDSILSMNEEIEWGESIKAMEKLALVPFGDRIVSHGYHFPFSRWLHTTRGAFLNSEATNVAHLHISEIPIRGHVGLIISEFLIKSVILAS